MNTIDQLPYLDEGRAFFYEEAWYVELLGGEQLFISRWPSPSLYLVRDENRRIEVSVISRKKAKFERFLD